jgi:hypothetical protein
MPIHADNSPNIKWPLPQGTPAFSRSDIFPPDLLALVRKTIHEQAVWGPGTDLHPYHTVSGRWSIEVEFPQVVIDHIEKLAKESWKRDDLKLKVVWEARYQQYQGITPYLWEHMDQPGTQYTMDICIESPGIPSWGLIIDGERFEEAENSAVFFMGQQQAHSRPPYPVDDPEAYVIVMFALFVGPEHWMYDIDAYDPDQDQYLDETTMNYKLDGDIRYYEYKGHAPRFDGMPANNRLCDSGTPGQECTQCDVVPENFIDNIEGYVHLK